jgi:hypothetical protein
MSITYWRGRLFRYLGPFDGLKLVQEVTLDEYLAMQYPPALVERFSEQSHADREKVRRKIQRHLRPGDALWLWSIVDSDDKVDGAPWERGGLAVVRAEVVVCVWQSWSGR